MSNIFYGFNKSNKSARLLNAKSTTSVQEKRVSVCLLDGVYQRRILNSVVVLIYISKRRHYIIIIALMAQTGLLYVNGGLQQ